MRVKSILGLEEATTTLATIFESVMISILVVGVVIVVIEICERNKWTRKITAILSSGR